MRKIYLLAIITSCLSIVGCDSYLEIVPDKLGTIEYAFRDQVSAERYLATCYYYIPNHADAGSYPGVTLGNDIATYYSARTNGTKILMDGNNVSSPMMNNWSKYYEALRHCNIFLENIGIVRDLEASEKQRWIFEVKFLKAYYHWLLIQQYGPIIMVRENLPISSTPEEVRQYREPLDDCIEYILSLLDEVIGQDDDEFGDRLPDKIDLMFTEYGRITRPMAAALRAKILVHAASPFYNGNQVYRNFKDNKGTLLWPQEYNAEKWVRAAKACKQAIDICESIGMQLYEYVPAGDMKISEDTRQILTFSQIITDRINNNSELIWPGMKENSRDVQFNRMPSLTQYYRTARLYSNINPTLEFVENYYSSNGVPIEEDVEWTNNNWYSSRYEIAAGEEEQSSAIEKGYLTARLNTHREPRFYGSVAFDGSRWYGGGISNPSETNMYTVKNLAGDPGGNPAGRNGTQYYSVTGYFIRKLASYQTFTTDQGTFTESKYFWPVMRLADLYLLYAEAKNETLETPDAEVYEYVNRVRRRAGLPDVQEAWTNYSTNPDKYQNKTGMRDIIHQERVIELAFESHYFYDLRRWSGGTQKSKFDIFEQYNKLMRGWNIEGENTEDYNIVRTIYSPKFSQRDLLWPIRESDILGNKNLVQNPGW